MRHFGLTGYPLSHSFSYSWFTRKFEEEGITDAAFFNYPLMSSRDIANLFSSDPMLLGISVTIPHKKSVIAILDSIDSIAGSIGAVNCIRAIRSEGGIHLRGFNTDCYGFRESLIEAGGGACRNALVLGSGGAASAVMHVLDELNCGYKVVSRGGGNNSLTYDDITNHHYREADLIVNCTPLGMYPEISGLPPIDYDAIGEDTMLFDLVYNPSVTAFMSEGVKRNLKVVNGLRMLELQAERSWSIWNYLNM